MEALLQDIRYSARTLLKKRGFTVVAVLTLALGIGANSAIFTVVNAVLLRPLPYEGADRLVMINQTRPHAQKDDGNVSDANFLDFKNRNDLFESMAAEVYWNFNLTGGDQPVRIEGAKVSASFFSVLKTSPEMGRAFSEEEDRPGSDDVVVISHRVWESQFGADPGALGRSVIIDTRPTTVIGIMPRDFNYPTHKTDMWKPVAFDPNNLTRGMNMYRVIARLKPGATVEQASSQVEAIAARLAQEHPEDNAGVGARVVSLYEQTVGDIRPAFLILLGAVGLVLLIACANVANLMLARSAAQSREVAIRTALGASRLRLIRQLLTESMLLAVAGGALGLLLALWGVDFLIALSPEDIPRVSEISTDARALLFMLGVSLLTGVIFGLAPALQSSKVDLHACLKEGGRGSTAGSGHRLRKALVVAEVAIALVLLVGAGLLIKSFVQLRSLDTGYDATNLLTLPVWLSSPRYEEPQPQADFARQASERIRSLPGVEAVGAALFLPLGGAQGNVDVMAEGRPPAERGQEPQGSINIVTPGYFGAMGIPLLAGRDFTEQETRDSAAVAIINEAMARELWPGEDAVGKRAALGEPESQDDYLTVVAVVKDVRQATLNEEPKPEIYLSYLQSPVAFPLMTLVVRTADSPASLVNPVRAEILAVDKDLPVYDVKTMEERLWDSVETERFQLLLLTIFAGVALALAAVGIYGVISYSVSERTHEIGIRMALGARQSSVLKMVLGQGLTLTLAGVAIGVGLALAATRLIAGLLYGVSATDPVTFVGVSALLVMVAALACFVPARRATKVDPMIALRCE
jgi:putative ABC transport system permease protein